MILDKERSVYSHEDHIQIKQVRLANPDGFKNHFEKTFKVHCSPYGYVDSKGDIQTWNINCAHFLGVYFTQFDKNLTFDSDELNALFIKINKLGDQNGGIRLSAMFKIADAYIERVSIENNLDVPKNGSSPILETP